MKKSGTQLAIFLKKFYQKYSTEPEFKVLTGSNTGSVFKVCDVVSSVKLNTLEQLALAVKY